MFNLVCHSMGGLAAREFITNPKYAPYNQLIDKVITIGTPHAGSPLANVRKDVADVIDGGYSYVWEIPYYGKLIEIKRVDTTDWILDSIIDKYGIDPEGEAIKDLAVASPFLKVLRQREFPEQIKKLAVYGIATTEQFHKLNHTFFGKYYLLEQKYTCGDGIVPIDSQKGYDIMSDYPFHAYWVWKPDKFVKIDADHKDELENKDIAHEILLFLDSTAPVLKLTSPDPTQPIVLNESSLRVQGEVYKEYLPADTELLINATREEDGLKLPEQTSLLKPSDLWQPNDPESPVAEFDEVINFPGTGTYKVTLKAKNPAELESEVVEFIVKVNIQNYTTVVIHVHNPEGKEINSLSYVEPRYFATLYVDDKVLGNGPYDTETHNRPFIVPAGKHTIKVVFNGMTLEKELDLKEYVQEELTFTFERINYMDEIKQKLHANFTHTISVTDWSSYRLETIYNETDSYQVSANFYAWRCNANISVTIQGTATTTDNILHYEGHLIDANSELLGEIGFDGMGASAYCYINTLKWLRVVTLPSTADRWYIQGRGYDIYGERIFIQNYISNPEVPHPAAAFTLGVQKQHTESYYSDMRYNYAFPPGEYDISANLNNAPPAHVGSYTKTQWLTEPSPGAEPIKQEHEAVEDYAKTQDFVLADYLTNVPYDFDGSGI